MRLLRFLNVHIVAMYLKEKIPVTTEETIEQINKEYEVISSSIPNDREFSDAD